METLFAQENQRKERLLSLYARLELERPKSKKDERLKHGFYDRVYNGVAEVARMGTTSLILRREDGRKLGTLIVSEEIVKSTKIGDRLGVVLGQKFGSWHLLHLIMIVSSVGKKDGKDLFHISGNNPALLPPEIFEEKANEKI